MMKTSYYLKNLVLLSFEETSHPCSEEIKDIFKDYYNLLHTQLLNFPFF